jgi:hypothetical protein
LGFFELPLLVIHLISNLGLYHPFWLAPNSKWEALNIKLGEQNIFETAQGIAIVSKSSLQASYKRPNYLFLRMSLRFFIV